MAIELSTPILLTAWIQTLAKYTFEYNFPLTLICIYIKSSSSGQDTDELLFRLWTTLERNMYEMTQNVFLKDYWGAWFLSDEVCDFDLAMDVTCSTSSILNLVAISFDRFFTVTFPIIYSQHHQSQTCLCCDTIMLVQFPSYQVSYHAWAQPSARKWWQFETGKVRQKLKNSTHLPCFRIISNHSEVVSETSEPLNCTFKPLALSSCLH